MSDQYYIIEYSIENSKKLNINRGKWDKIKQAKSVISHIRYIEQKYDLMISNYYEFERELLEQALDTSIRNPNRQSISLATLSLARQIINLITSISLYIDHVKKRHIGNLPFSDKKRETLLKELKDYQSNSNDLKFIRNLRNYVIHRDLPLDSYTMKSSWEKLENEEVEKGGHLIIPTIQKDKLLKDRKFSTNVVEKMIEDSEKIDLRIPIRKTIEIISQFNKSFRQQISNDFQSAKDIIKETIKESNEFSKSNNKYCRVIREVDSNVKEIIYLDKHHIDQIELFYQRNSSQGNLENRYIHNRI
jgi:hypothetical protein